jgi:hypothetical protein
MPGNQENLISNHKSNKKPNAANQPLQRNALNNFTEKDLLSRSLLRALRIQGIQ